MERSEPPTIPSRCRINGRHDYLQTCPQREPAVCEHLRIPATRPEATRADAMSTTDNVLSITRQGPVLRLTLSRPQRRNALSRALVGALLDAITAVDPSTTRVIVLAGEGTAFCAGGDISEYAESAAAGRAEADAETLTALL